MFVSRSVPNYLGNLASLSVSFASKPHGESRYQYATEHTTIHMEITQFAALLHGYLFQSI